MTFTAEDEAEKRLIRQCLGKTGWPSKVAAEESRKAQRNLYYVLETYECRLCNLWHLGHKKKEKI